MANSTEKDHDKLRKLGIDGITNDDQKLICDDEDLCEENAKRQWKILLANIWVSKWVTKDIYMQCKLNSISHKCAMVLANRSVFSRHLKDSKSDKVKQNLI